MGCVVSIYALADFSGERSGVNATRYCYYKSVESSTGIRGFYLCTTTMAGLVGSSPRMDRNGLVGSCAWHSGFMCMEGLAGSYTWRVWWAHAHDSGRSESGTEKTSPSRNRTVTFFINLEAQSR